MAAIYRLDSGFDRSMFENASCAFGVFDGVHVGHRFLLDKAIESAQSHGGMSLALTFDIDPDELFHADRLRKLMTNEDRIDFLANSGVDAVVCLPFTPEFAAHSPERFLAESFGEYAPKYIHIGANFRFGARAQGNVSDLQEWARPRGTNICAWSLQEVDGGVVSATRIRNLLAAGNIEQANSLLGRHYALHGEVLHGRGEGASMGFRTANMAIDDMLRPIGDGVYAAYAFVDGDCYKAAVNVGIAPMFKEATATIEAHLLDFCGDLYNKQLRIEFTNWLRAKQQFSSVEELISTVNSNIAWVNSNL